ncbi:MAG: helix-turn-helix transcriptional regulator [Gemmatimonadetes bacterium]|nr:helix-turn-helix transcriptional regulator [Gemmatimonadota bacterium]
MNRAALGHVTWVSAATSINDLIRTGGHSLTYFGANPATRIPAIHLSRFFVGAEHRPDLERSYYRDYFRRDEAVPRLVGIRDRELVYKSDIYSDQEKKTSVAYNEFRRVNKTENGLFMGIGGIDGCGLIMSFANSTEGNGWTGDQLGTIRRLAPHMRQFARVRRALADARASSASLVDLLENRRLGLIQLDRSGCVLEANDRARDVLLECDGLHDRGGRLAAGHRWENAELQSLLARALPPWGAQGVGGSMKITRGAARGPLVLEIHPTRQTDAAWRLGALVLIVDPVDRLKVAPDLVTRLLGLTPTESRVAVAVAAGQTVVGTSRELGCAESTVQTHLKRVYRKLGIHKQTELVRSVVSLEALG